MMPAKRAASASGSAPPMRICENARIEVIGVRNSWLIWPRNASFCNDSCVSLAFASRNWRAVRVSSSDFASNWLEYSIICAVSLATAIRSSTDTAAPPPICAIIAWAVAAPTEPDNSRSSRSTNSGVVSGSNPSRPCARA